jgi:hypothetical protein
MADALSEVMMLKILPLTALALGLSSGVALADHRGGEYRGGPRMAGDHRVAVEHRAAPGVRDHREFRGGAVVRGGEWRGRTFVNGGRDWHGGGRVIVREPYYRDHVVRRPIFVGRPIIRDHYYNYYRRPALVVESYGAMPGYYWLAGHWYWNGYEWLWQPGHYQPDPSYVDPAYADPGY